MYGVGSNEAIIEWQIVTIGDRLTVGCLALNQVVEVRVLLPELRRLG